MRLTVLLAALVVAAVEARADEVVMKNGDKITGKVVDLAGGKLRVETAHSGVVVLEWSQVATIKTDAPVKVKLATGETVEGKIGAGQDGKILVESPGAGPLELTSDRIKSFNEPPVSWHGAVDLAARTSDGNTHSTSMLLAFEASRATEVDKLLWKAVFRYGETRNIITERNGYGMVKYDYLFSERVYGFVVGELLSDKFKDLQLRSVVAAGAGYIFLKSPEMDFWGDAGLAYVDNDLRDGDDEAHAGARISAHVRKTLPLGFELVDDVTFLPNFEEGDNWQLRNDLALTTALGQGWSFKGGMITEYDNDPPDGLREHDDTYYVGLGYRF
jgi:putative salt-induced outer membrane protein YdiY